METGKCSHTSLVLVSFDDRFAFTCNGCKELGYRSCYTCHQECNYHLHKECQMRTPIISHPFFAQAHFVLDQTGTSPTSLCEACGASLEGWSYALTSNGVTFNISLHPCCANLPYTSDVNGELFTLSHKTLDSFRMSCAHCRQSNGAKGWAYVSTRLNVGVHVKCIKDINHQCWEKTYYGANNQQVDYQERGLNHQQRRFRKRDIIFGAANLALNVLGVGDPTNLALLVVDLAINLWRRWSIRVWTINLL